MFLKKHPTQGVFYCVILAWVLLGEGLFVRWAGFSVDNPFACDWLKEYNGEYISHQCITLIRE